MEHSTQHMKVILNTNNHSFELSTIAKGLLLQQGIDVSLRLDLLRVHKKVIEIVESLGPLANGGGAKLEIFEIPDDMEWYIRTSDGRDMLYVRKMHYTT